MTAEQKLLEEVLEFANRHDAEAIQDCLADDMAFFNPITGHTGRDGMYQVHTTLFKAFPDLHYGLDRSLVSGSAVVLECTVSGTHQNELMGIEATSNRIEVPAAFVADVKDDKITKWSSYFDVATLMRQLGVGG